MGSKINLVYSINIILAIVHIIIRQSSWLLKLKDLYYHRYISFEQYTVASKRSER